MNSLFKAFDENFAAVNNCIRGNFPQYQEIFKPLQKNYLLEKTDNGYLYTVLLPGFEKSEIGLKVDGSYLVLNATKKEHTTFDALIEKSVQQRHYLGDIDDENIDASLFNGILQVKVPLKKKAGIDIQVK
jgi:HSP20 family molecular chaperone IbpA